MSISEYRHRVNCYCVIERLSRNGWRWSEIESELKRLGYLKYLDI